MGIRLWRRAGIRIHEPRGLAAFKATATDQLYHLSPGSPFVAFNVRSWTFLTAREVENTIAERVPAVRPKGVGKSGIRFRSLSRG